MVTAKLFVSFGAFSQNSCGEVFFPVQPKPFSTCLSVACPPSSLLFKVKVCAVKIPTCHVAIIVRMKFFISLFFEHKYQDGNEKKIRLLAQKLFLLVQIRHEMFK